MVWCSPRTPIRPSRSTRPAEPARRAAGSQARRAGRSSRWLPPTLTAQTLSAEDTAVADRLRELVESKLQQFVPQEQDRAGVLAFYRDRNFAPLWTASGKPAPRAEQAVDIPARRRGRRPRSGGLSDADLRQCRSGQARRGRTGADQFRRQLRASRQHRPRGVHAGERRGLLRPEGAQSQPTCWARSPTAPTSAPRSTRSIRRRRNTRR